VRTYTEPHGCDESSERQRSDGPQRTFFDRGRVRAGSTLLVQNCGLLPVSMSHPAEQRYPSTESFIRVFAVIHGVIGALVGGYSRVAVNPYVEV
jgi:hypothetical protein